MNRARDDGRFDAWRRWWTFPGGYLIVYTNGLWIDVFDIYEPGAAAQHG